jgi:uncharacterized protein (TIGR02391 family)
MSPDFPSPELVLQMEPEELAPHILRELKAMPKNGINRYNFSLINDHRLAQELGQRQGDYAERLMEAWTLLEREGFVAPRPGQQGEWQFVTRKGQRVIDAEDFAAHRKAGMFSDDLDPVLVRTVKPLFIRGDYDTAAFRAFKEVEVRVRNKGGFGHGDYGIDLMKKAFGPGGPLADARAPQGEQDRTRDLFVGCIGAFKNPLSHREVNFDDPREVIDVICTANQLLRIVDRA